MTTRALALATLGLASGLAGCARKPPPKAADPVPVLAAVVETRDVPLEVQAIGHVDPVSTVSLKSQVAAEVTEVHFREGQDVARGDLLFRLDARPFQAALQESEANLARDRARSSAAAQDRKRYAALVAKDFVTQEQYDQIVSNAESFAATVKADEAAIERARLSLAYCAISSPISGRTGGLLVHAGNVVKANDDKPLVVINQVEPIYVTFAVPEAVLPEVKARAAKGTLKVSAVPNGPGASASEGDLTFIDNAVDTTTGTINLRATFPNRNRALWPGQFANVSLTLTTEPKALVIPSEAIQTGQKGTYVYVIGPDDRVETRAVTVLRDWRQWSIIASGLTGGERVVTDGQLRLAPGVKVAVKEPETAPPGEKRS